MSTGRVTGMNNHAGDLAPLKSWWGQRLFAGTSQLIDQPAPIGHQWDNGFRGTVGATVIRSAAVTPLFHPGGYFGDMPQSQQGIVSAVEPWNRP